MAVTLRRPRRPRGKPAQVAEVINGIAIGSAGGVGTVYEGFKLVYGDDFNAEPSVWSGRDIGGKYAMNPPYIGFRRISPGDADRMYYVEPGYRGVRSESPANLNTNPRSVAASVLTLTPQVPAAAFEKYLPSNYTQGGGDRVNRPRLISSCLKTWPSFMLSGKGDWIFECKVKFAAGAARGYWPSAWLTCINWPDFGEFDLIEVKRDVSNNNDIRINVNVSDTDGGANATTNLTQREDVPTGRYITMQVVKTGSQVRIYDDVASEGTLVPVATYNNTRVSRFRGAWDVRFDAAVNTDWDSSSFSGADWPKNYDIDWFRVWTPVAAGDNTPMNVLGFVNTTAGGSWAYTIPSDTALFGGAVDVVEAYAAFDNLDTPGMPTRANRLPGGMTVNLTTRQITGTVPLTEGGRVGVLFLGSFNAGGPARRAIVYFNVAPIVDKMPSNMVIKAGSAFDFTFDYECFHSGNLGHTISVAVVSNGGWLTISGNGTSEVRLTGTVPADGTVTSITVTAINGAGQTTQVTRTFTASAAAPVYAGWDGPGWYDFSDASKVNLAGSPAVANKRTGRGDLNLAGSTAGANITIAAAAQNGRDVIQVARDVSVYTAVPHLAAPFEAKVSRAFQGDDVPVTVLCCYKPTDTNTGFPWSAGETVDGSNRQALAVVSRSTPNTSIVRSLDGATSATQNWGTGQASGTWRVLAVRFEGTTVTVHDNSLAKALDSVALNVAAFNNYNAFRLFCRPNIGGTTETRPELNQRAMQMGEVIVEDRAVPDAELQQAITDMAAKWGITLS